MYTIQQIIQAYEILVKGIETKAQDDDERAYGGIIRAGKGLLVENITKRLIEIAWSELQGQSQRLSLDKHTVKIPLKKDYLNKIKSKEVVEYIKKNIDDYYYTMKTDVHVYIDNNFILGVECKAYTENAMLKRILVDFTLLKQIYPNLKCALLQLESQLTGDYSVPIKPIIYGSPSTHTLMSYFDVDLNIITLLNGERKVDKPIHKEAHYKELHEKVLLIAVNTFKNILKEYL
ncbi:MAG: restriction endonuclease [Bacteroidales bacterium]|nr:restriction endonuclease [Bacteroidales bacterium]